MGLRPIWSCAPAWSFCIELAVTARDNSWFSLASMDKSCPCTRVALTQLGSCVRQQSRPQSVQKRLMVSMPGSINTFDPGNGDGKTRCVLTCWKKQHRSTCTMITETGKAKKGPDFVWKGCQTQEKWPFFLKTFTLRRLRNTERVVIFWQWWCAYTRDSAPGG